MVGSSRRLFAVFVFMLVCSFSSRIVIDGYKLKCHEQQNATEYAVGKCVLVHSSADDLKWNEAEEKCSKLSDDDHVWSLPESMNFTDDKGKALREEMDKFYSDDAVGKQRVFVFWLNETSKVIPGFCSIAIWKWFETKNSSEAIPNQLPCDQKLLFYVRINLADSDLASNFVLVCESRLRNENPINGSDPLQVDEATQSPSNSDDDTDNSTVWLVLGICLGAMFICTVMIVGLLLVRRNRKIRELTTLRAVSSRKSTIKSSIEGSDKKMLKSKSKTTPIMTKGVGGDKVDGSKQPESSTLSSSKKSNQGSKGSWRISKKSADARQDGGKSMMGSKKVEMTKKVMISGK